MSDVPQGGVQRSGGSITFRAVLATCAVALISVAITAAIAFPLVLRSTAAEQRRTLGQKARVAAEAIEGRDVPGAQRRADLRARRVVAVLGEQGIQAVVIRDGVAEPSGLSPDVVRRVAQGESVSRRVRFQGVLMHAEGRPAGPGDGIVLLQPARTLTAGAVLARIWLALAGGLVAGLVVGGVLARRLVRPLRDAAAAARRLSAGDRRARAPTDAPAEVAAVSLALNDLAEALATSENRQRAFLMSVSHELRTPLTTIQGYAEALADRVVEPDGVAEVGATILAESRRLDRLVEDLLALARLEADDFPLEILDVDVVALANDAQRAWRQRAEAAGVRLRTELPAQPLWIRSDPGRLRQVIDGLLENALRLVPSGAPVVLAVADAGTHVAVEVRDGGPGFSDDDLAVAFEQGALSARYRGVRKVGTGLGLALAARLVRRLGGTIEAGHAPEGGARLTVRLPR